MKLRTVLSWTILPPGTLDARSNHCDQEVNWISDADIKGFFDNVSHEHLEQLLRNA